MLDLVDQLEILQDDFNSGRFVAPELDDSEKDFHGLTRIIDAWDFKPEWDLVEE